MRLRNLLTGLALLLCPVAAGAQSTGGTTATLVVDIASGLSVFTENSLSFGTVIAGTGVKTVALTSASAGKFRVQGTRNSNVNMTLTAPATLTNGVSTIPFTMQAAKNENADDATAATAVTSSHVLRLRFRVNAQTGNGWLYIHGSINASNAALTPGVYSGVVTVSAAY